MAMNEWHKYPFVRILIPFIAGILISMKLEPTPDHARSFLIMFVLILSIAMFFHKYINFRNRLIFGGLVFLTVLVGGLLWHSVYNQYHMHGHFSKSYTSESSLVAQLEAYPEEAQRSWKSILKVKTLIDSAGDRIPAKGKIIAYFEPTSQVEKAQYGDKVIFSGYVEQVESARNPAAFDYSEYLAKRHVYHSVYLPADSYRIVSDNVKTTRAFAMKTRHHLGGLLKRYGLEGNEFSLASALVLGYDKYLGDDMRLWYTNAGAMHILCVSGLHVGIIYVVMMFLMQLLPWNTNTSRSVKVVLVILFIWGYAFVTGLEPAVMRASVMFSMVALGKLLHRKTRIYNTLAASAFIMLLANPEMISWVGFQMSYLAVFGIVWLQPQIYHWWTPRNRLADYFWGLVAVSLAAQIILFPLLLFYFHKISLIFFITNIFAIPMATGVLYLSLLLFAMSGVPVVAEYIAAALKGMVELLNFLVEKVSTLPAAYVDEVWIQEWQMLLIYGSLLIIITALIRKRKNLVPSLLGAGVILFIILGGIRLQKHINNQFILYHVREGLAMDFITADSSVFLADSAVIGNRQIINYNIKNSWNSRYVHPRILPAEHEEAFAQRNVFYKKPFVLFNDDIYFILNRSPDIIPDKKIVVDYLVIAGKPWIDAENLTSLFDIRKKVLISGSSPYWLAEKWERAFAEHGVECYSTHRDGAFIASYR